MSEGLADDDAIALPPPAVIGRYKCVTEERMAELLAAESRERAAAQAAARRGREGDCCRRGPRGHRQRRCVMEETWTQIAQMRPRAERFRVVCAEPGCGLNQWPARFVAQDTAEAWARDHADSSRHVAMVQELEEPE